jgi:hypothetical protein
MGTQRLEGTESKEVFFVEVGGDDQEACRIELMESMVKKRSPELRAVPKILMPKEG